MMLPRLYDAAKARAVHIEFGGLNMTENARAGEMADCGGISTAILPKLAAANGDLLILRESAGKFIGFAGSRQSYFYKTISGGAVSVYFKAAGGEKIAVISNLYHPYPKLAFDGAPIVKFGGYIWFFGGVQGISGVWCNKKINEQTLAVEDIAPSCPDIAHACVCGNRIFGVGVDKATRAPTIYACSPGNGDEWDAYVNPDGTPSEKSYAVSIGGELAFTGIVAYQGSVFAFTASEMYELAGTRPSNFTLLKVAETGCSDKRSIAEVGGALYFLSSGGVMRFAGGAPDCISRELPKITSGAAAGDERYYYLAAGDARYVLDTVNGAWSKRDAAAVAGYVRALEGGGAAIYYAKGLYDLNGEPLGFEIYKQGGAPPGQWFFELPRQDFGLAETERIRKLALKISLDGGAKFQVFLLCGGEKRLVFDSAASAAQINDGAASIKIRAPRRPGFALRLEGEGGATVHDLIEYIEYGGDL